MGKLTGPSTHPTERGTKVNSDDTQSQKTEQGGTSVTTESSSNQQLSGENNSHTSNSNHGSERISFNNGRNQRNQLNSSNKSNPSNRQSNNSQFSSSMLLAVNNAAETARLVLDQAALHEITADDSKSVSSHGSRRPALAGSGGSVSGGSSVHSRNSSQGSLNGFGLGVADHTSLSILGDEDGLTLDTDCKVHENVNTKIEEAATDTSGEIFMRSESSTDLGPVPTFSPPPTAFNNLPMTRHVFTPSHKDVDGSDDQDLLADGKVFEVTHQSAAVISAALAATGNVGELQMKQTHPYPAVKRRSTTSCEEGCGPALPRTQFRRANSGDAVRSFLNAMNEESSTHVVATKDQSENSPLQRRPAGLPTPEEAEAEMLSHRSSFMSGDDSLGSAADDIIETIMAGNLISEDKKLNNFVIPTKTDSGSEDQPPRRKSTGLPFGSYLPVRKDSTTKDDSPPRRKSTGLPSKEEAEAEMLYNRTSFVSVDDLSFGEDRERLIATLKKFKEGDKKQSTHEGQAEKGISDPKEQQEKIVNAESKKSGDIKHLSQRNAATPMKSDDSTSNCSSSGFENESNTSSYDGKSGYSADISPISSVTGETSEIKPSGDSKKGMLGNLAHSRRALGDTNHSADDEYSTQSENSGVNAIRKEHLPRRGKEDEKMKAANASTTKSTPGVKPMPSRKPQGLVGKADDSTASSSTIIDYVAPLPAESQPTLVKQSSETDQSLHVAPPHRVSLFDSFDRNWEQAVQGCKDPQKILDLCRKCFASFAVVFGSCTDTNGRPIFSCGDAANNEVDTAEQKLSSFSWWVDENALTTVGDMFQPSSTHEGISDQEEDLQSIPIVVIQTLWKACFFDEEQTSAEAKDDIDSIISVIQKILVKDLCYLSAHATASTPCLRLSLDVYAEYGWYILRHHSMENQISCWHKRLSTVLRRMLLDNSLTDTSSVIIQRYAAQSLPRHTAISVLGVDIEGHVQTDNISEEKRAEMRVHLLERLLGDSGFIQARADLLGRGNTRPGSVDESMDSDDTNPQIVKHIRKTRDDDRNLHFSSAVHMKDIEMFIQLSQNQKEAGERQENGKVTPSLFSDCLVAMGKLKEELVTSFQALQGSGKLSINDKSKTPKVTFRSEVKDPASADPLVQLLSHRNGAIDRNSGESCTEAVMSLLGADDAWTRKDDSATVFKKGTHQKGISPRPPRKGRKRAGHKEDAATTTSLAQILNIKICDLRTTISLGRSLLGLVEFSQHLAEAVFVKEMKDSTVISELHDLQCSCLQNAIEFLSQSAITLCYILSSSLDKLDEDDLDETVCLGSMGPDALLRRFAMTREESKPLLSVAGILSADAWFSFGKLVCKASKMNTNNLMLFSFERALMILNSSKSTSSLNKPALDVLCESLLSPLTQYKCFLQSNINHSIGVYAYEQGEFERASEFLEKSTTYRRQMLDDLRGQADDSADQSHGSKKLFNAAGNYLVSLAAIPECVFANLFEYAFGFSCVQLPRETFLVNELELSLSLTLEYCALTQHAGHKYQLALSFFQESLILRTIHVGKNSLDVASLHFNMGVVYDDLDQSDQAISRYHESLRIRLDQMKDTSNSAIVTELEDSVLLTLKCMGHVYKIINDLDSSFHCYVKALEMVNKKLSTHLEHADEFSKMGMRLGLSVPVPTIIFDEMKGSSSDSDTTCKPHFQMMNKKELCHVFEPKLTKRRSRSTMSKLRKEVSKLHTTVIDLIHERKQNSWDNESGSSRIKLPGSSLLLASLSSTFKTGGDAFEAALMRSSFALGRLRLEQMRYEEAADHLETALRSKWVLDPASSSDSDSDFSRKSRSSRNQPAKSIDEYDPEEGQIYYSLGVCNAALDDHERAVRCFLTSMRYLRRSLRKVDSLEVARVLFDCATSHYYLCNFDQAVSLYGECLRIIKSYEDNEGRFLSANDDVSKTQVFRRGIVLYCLVVARSAIEFDSETSNLLNEAQILLSGCNDRIILAYMEYLTGLFLHHAASQVPVRLRSITRITPVGLSLSDGLSWNEMCKSALNLLEQVKNECWFDPLEGVEDSEEVKHLPLSGHICFKKGQVYELIDSVDQALNSYVDAANFYRIACGDENMYVASVLHRMGMICSQRTEYHALGYFNEALQIRRTLLGGNDHLVAETLYCSAVVLARLNRYEASMERYHEALRIQMADSQDSNEVARTLAGMGNCHYDHQAYDLAFTCFEGAVKIRKYRVSHLTSSEELVELYSEEVSLGADYFNLGSTHMQMGDYAQAMQCFIQSRDLRWRHVGSGTVDAILDKYYSETVIDEDELLGLAHCLHNIGVMFDIKKEYNRSLPHYEEALAIKNAIAGFSERDSMSLVDQVNPEDNQALVLQSLHKDSDFPRINKATLSASVTRQKIATVYAKQRKYDHALFHFSHALRIQRHVLGKDNFRIGGILTSMGNALRRTSRNSDTAILCFNESLRISKLRFGHHHATVASALFDIGSLYDSNKNFGKAMHYYQRAMSVYKQKYSQELRHRLCSGLSSLDRPIDLIEDDEGNTEILSTGDEIVVAGDASTPAKKIREQYARVTKALRTAKTRDMINRGESIGCCGDSNDAWLTFEVLLFRFVEMLSTYIVDPAQAVVRDTIDNSRRRIESAAAEAVISAADAMDYQFLVMLQER